ncbi:hypothetical protein OH76DRAFT_104003 [Lentinus brumalis]|uniref:Acid protease n=1 Tax=Lentinus brumalis TaxID=2498619 RepID=A0A371CQ39_9APHY|nr:hypothetical protein OH76DRAFT_104003 [Polyporus brumalis]
MFGFTRLTLLVAALVTTAAALTPTRTPSGALAELLTPAEDPSRLTMNPAEPLTNAERLRRGLSPNRPRARYAGRGAQAIGRRQGASPVPCVTQTGKIKVTYTYWPAGGLKASGWLSRNVNTLGEYVFNTDASQALSVTICPQTTTNAFDIQTLNGLANYPYIGGVVGPTNSRVNGNDLGDSSNVLYVAGVSEAPYGPAVSGPSAHGTNSKFESHMWSMGANNELLPSWVNDDGTVYSGQKLVHYSVLGIEAIFVTGNVDKFYATFQVPTDIVNFYFVPA